MVRRIPVHNTVKNQPEILEGELVDEIKEPSVFVDRNGKSYDASKGLKVSDLPDAPLTQLPRTTWYAFAPRPVEEDLVIVGYMNGPEGCVPIYERRSHGKNSGVRPDVLRSVEPAKSRRNWRARKAARAADALELPDGSGSGSGSAQP